MAQSTLRRSKSVPDFSNKKPKANSEDYFKMEFPTHWGPMTPSMMMLEYAELDGRFKELRKRREEERKVFQDLVQSNRVQTQVTNQNMAIVARLTWQLKHREHGILRSLPCFVSCMIRPGDNRRFEFGEPDQPDFSTQNTVLSIAQRNRLRHRNLPNDNLCIICSVEPICMISWKCLHGSFCYACCIAYIRDKWDQFAENFPGHGDFHLENQGPDILCPQCRGFTLGYLKVYL